MAVLVFLMLLISETLVPVLTTNLTCLMKSFAFGVIWKLPLS